VKELRERFAKELLTIILILFIEKKKNKPQTNTLVLYQLLINQRVVTAMDLLSEKNAFPA